MIICALYRVHGVLSFADVKIKKTERRKSGASMRKKKRKQVDEKRKDMKMYFPGKKRGTRAA